MTLKEFAKLAVRKRKQVRNGAISASLPLGAKKEDDLDKYQDYENPPAPQRPNNGQYNSYTGGELR